jgi:hypothetical protein
MVNKTKSIEMFLIELSAWTFSNREITDLKPEFESEFNIKLTRDYENDWEWIWNGNQSINKINVSREHNWKTGKYSKPLRIDIKWNIAEFQREELIEKIQNILKSDLHFGIISNRGINLEDYKIDQTIKYET